MSKLLFARERLGWACPLSSLRIALALHYLRAAVHPSSLFFLLSRCGGGGARRLRPSQVAAATVLTRPRLARLVSRSLRSGARAGG